MAAQQRAWWLPAWMGRPLPSVSLEGDLEQGVDRRHAERPVAVAQSAADAARLRSCRTRAGCGHGCARRAARPMIALASDPRRRPTVAGDEALHLTMELQDGYRFLVDFHQDGVAPLVMDEPAPLGDGSGPNAARMLAAGVDVVVHAAGRDVAA